MTFRNLIQALFVLLAVGCATNNRGDASNPTGTAYVPPSADLWHNFNLPHDVNGDGLVTAGDMNNILNAINRGGEHPLHGSAYYSNMYRVDVNYDGHVTIMDAYLILADISIIREEGAGPTLRSANPEQRRYELGYDTAKQFYKLCPTEPVSQINGAFPSAGERWFQSKRTDSNGNRVYFAVYPNGNLMRLASGSTTNPDKLVANLPMSLFDDTDDPFSYGFYTESSSNPYGCPKTNLY